MRPSAPSVYDLPPMDVLNQNPNGSSHHGLPAYNPNSHMEPEIDVQVPERHSMTEAQIRSLVDMGFTRSMAQSFQTMKERIALRVWVVDNSSSMLEADGTLVIGDMNSKAKTPWRTASCTRWDELRKCIEEQITLASAIGAPTTFRFLNKPSGGVGGCDDIVVARHGIPVPNEVLRGIATLDRFEPRGATPLTQHVIQIREEVVQMTPMLHASGQRVAIILATDGLPTDEQGYGGKRQRDQFVESLRSLEGLPVWIVIRLCTDEEEVVDFYTELDNVLELSIEVVDDFVEEAKGVHKMNPWINYSLPLHRMREMGYHERIFDLLDERPLTKREVQEFCRILYGKDQFDGAPHPDFDWRAFVKHISSVARECSEQWNPITKRYGTLIDAVRLNRTYGRPWFRCF